MTSPSIQLFWSQPPDALANALDRKCSDLTDLDPRTLGELHAGDFKSEGETGLLLLAGDGHADHRPGPGVEDILTDYGNRTLASLFMAADRVQLHERLEEPFRVRVGRAEPQDLGELGDRVFVAPRIREGHAQVEVAVDESGVDPERLAQLIDPLGP